MSRSLLLPEFFVDRSLGRHQVSATLRTAGWRLQTHHEVYGARDENVPDVEWLEYCGSRLVVLSKDQRLRYNPPEIGVIRTFGVKVFVLTSGNLTGTAQAERFVQQGARIGLAAAASGPMVYAVRATGIELLAD